MFSKYSRYGTLFGIFLVVSLCTSHLAVADTRYECVSGGYGGRYGDDFEADEIGSTRMWTSGTLSCPQTDRGSILVIRVGYGSSIIPGRCESDTYCREEYDTADVIADRCDGRSSCYIDMVPRYMNCGRWSNYMMIEYECIDSWKTFEVCEQVSTVSRGASVFITSPGYLDFRPPAASRGTQMCECIIQSQDRADLYLDYLQTQISKAGDTCPYEYVLLESKKNLTQSSIDKEMEICGRRHIGNKWYSGSVRITYASGGPMRRNGLVAKFTVDNIGNLPNIEIDCGTVNANGMRLKEPPPTLSETQAGTVSRTRIRSDPYLDSRSPSPFSPLEPSRNLRADFDRYLQMDEMEADEGPYDDAAERLLRPFDDAAERMLHPLGQGGPLPPPLNTARLDPPPRGRAPPPRRRDPPPRRSDPPPRHWDPPPPPAPRPKDQTPAPDFTSWKINLPETPAPGFAVNPELNSAFLSREPVPKTLPVVEPEPPRKQEPQKVVPKDKGPVERLGKGVVRRPIQRKRNPQAQNPSPKKVVDENLAKLEDSEASGPDTGSYVALVVAGIGAVLIVGSFGIVVLHNYRKRQRIRAKEAEYAISGGSASSTYGQGWHSDDESIYATISDVDKHRPGCVNPALSDEELKLNTTETSIDTFVGQQVDRDFKCDNNPGTTAPDNVEGANVVKGKAVEIAVIEVHQSLEGSADVERHTQGCLPSCEYLGVNRDNRDVNICSACSITRPPRRKDTARGYDNNIGVKHKHK